MELPKAFTERMKALLGDDFERFIAAYARPPARALHLNPAKITPGQLEAAVDFPIRRLPFGRSGYLFENESIGRHPLHHAGAVYVQEPSAMMPLSLVGGIDFPDDLRILDLCASPGGKSSQAAALLRGRPKGWLISNEIVEKRCMILCQNIERLGICNVGITRCSSDQLSVPLAECCDLVIVDAPCSGEGMFRKNPEAIAEWSEENVRRCAERQRIILTEAAKTVAGGGYLIYSTCTFSLEENEENVAWFLATHPDFELCPPPEDVAALTADGIGEGMKHCRRFYPHLAEGEGQFAALMRRKAGERRSPRLILPDQRPKKTTAEALSLVRAFLAETLGDCAQHLLPFQCGGDRWAVLEAEAELPDLPYYGRFCPGVEVGILQKGRIIPSHRYFSAYGAGFVHRLELDRRSAEAYLRGETLPCTDFVGWGVASYAGVTLGGLKVSSGVAKNHYPKGLRNLR